MSSREDSIQKQGAGRWLPLIALLLLALTLLFVKLGEAGAYSAQEGRAGIIVRNMVDTNDYLTMKFQGHDVTEKPIFFYWLCLGSCKIFGYNEFAIRFPAAASAFFGVLLAYLIGRRAYGEKTGLMAGIALATTLYFVHFGRIARIDIVLGVAYTWAMYLLYRGYFEEMKPNWRLYAFYFVLGVCVLIKGPVAVALAGFGVVLFACVKRDWRIFWDLKPLSGLAIGAAVTCPWFIYEWVRTNGEYTTQFLLSHNVERYLDISGTYGGGKRKPLFFYVPNVIAGALPWSVFLPFGAWTLWKSFKSLRPQTWFFICWFASVFIFFSFSAYKRPDYLTPLYPCLAILVGRMITRMQEEGFSLGRWWLWAWGALAAAVATTIVLIKTGAASALTSIAIADDVPFISERDARSALQFFDLANANFAIFCGATLAALALVFACGKLFSKGMVEKAALTIACIAFVAHLGYIVAVEPAAQVFKTLRNEAKIYANALPRGAEIYYCDVENVEELVFYIDAGYDEGKANKIVTADGTLYKPALVVRESVYEDLPDALKSRFEIVTRTAPGHQYPTVFCLAKQLPVKDLSADR